MLFDRLGLAATTAWPSFQNNLGSPKDRPLEGIGDEGQIACGHSAFTDLGTMGGNAQRGVGQGTLLP